MLNAERLKALREKASLTQDDLAKELGCSKWTVLRLEKGERDAKGAEIEKMSHLFGVSVDYLMGRDPEPQAQTVEKKPKITSVQQLKQKGFPPPEEIGGKVERVPASGKVIYVPVFELGSVCAGYGDYSYEMTADEILAFPVEIFGSPISTDPDKRPYVIRVHGDSMNGVGIRDGSSICVNPAMEVYDGDIAVVRLDGEEFVKRVFWNRNGGGGVLRAANPDYLPIKFTVGDVDRGDFDILGKVTYTLNKV